MSNAELDKLTLIPDLLKYGGGMSFEARQIIDIVTSSGDQAQKLMKNIGWLSANTRDYDYPPGDWLVPEIFASVTEPEILKDLLAPPIAEILDLLPDITDEMVSRRKVDSREKASVERLRSGVVINSLAFATQIRRPGVLQSPLERLFAERIISPGVGIATQDNRDYLRDAMIVNQGDQRFRLVWLGMIRSNKHNYLPGGRSEGLAGVLEMPSTDPDNQFAYDAIAEAGKWFGRVRYKYPYYDADGAKFNVGFLLPVLYKFKFAEQYWDHLQKAVDDVGWSAGKMAKLGAFRSSLTKLKELAIDAAYYRSEHRRLIGQFGIGRDNAGTPEQQAHIQLSSYAEMGALSWMSYLLGERKEIYMDVNKLVGEEEGGRI